MLESIRTIKKLELRECILKRAKSNKSKAAKKGYLKEQKEQKLKRRTY